MAYTCYVFTRCAVKEITFNFHAICECDLHVRFVPLQREKELMEMRERYTELEEKIENMGSTLEAYGHSSESEVIHRLQSEVRPPSQLSGSWGNPLNYAVNAWWPL